ncbi:hypothetical protein [Geobacter benzoatilyticus]|uniref:Uncharacterized protein n=1 Tax=Geobacter benzoatilyticus TaxID=2815309 RepID=A0ABX7Q4J6_9BACT|nr:hypothetical protein [Geobacter benzoatilyticus]QSV45955.1 hypothetical protein JZM60_01265 [Geobacter benzoatilyticus]
MAPRKTDANRQIITSIVVPLPPPPITPCETAESALTLVQALASFIG